MDVHTIGFTRKTAEEFFGRLKRSGALRILDVRLHGTSQLAGFAKVPDLGFFLVKICRMEYIAVPELAPTEALLDDYRKRRVDWPTYEKRFLGLMRARRIEKTVRRELIDGGCLLCSEDQPHQCHRRLVAEYLARAWGNLEIRHL